MCKSIKICGGSYLVYNDNIDPYKEIFDAKGFTYDFEHLDKILNMIVQYQDENEWDDGIDEFESIYDAMDGVSYHGSYIRTFPTGETVSYHHIDNFYGNKKFRQIGGETEGFVINVEYVDVVIGKKIRIALSELLPDQDIDLNNGRLIFCIKAYFGAKKEERQEISQIVDKISIILETIFAENTNVTQGNKCPNCGGTFEYGEAQCSYCHYISPIREATKQLEEKNKENIDAAIKMNKQQTKRTFMTLLLVAVIFYVAYNVLIVAVFIASQVFHLF